jgi:hypothetical protein
MKIILQIYKPSDAKGYERTLNARLSKLPTANLWKQFANEYKDVFDFQLQIGGSWGKSGRSWATVDPVTLIEHLSDELRLHAKDTEEYTRVIKLIPKSKQNWHPICVATYSPKVEATDFYNKSVAARLSVLTAAIAEGIDLGAQIVVGPEFFFYAPAADGKTKAPCSQTEMQTVDEGLRKLSDKNPDVLIIAGTILWINNEGAIFNTLLKYCKRIGLNATDNPYHKKYWPGQEGPTALKFGQPQTDNKVGTPYTEFQIDGWTCVAQICADCGESLTVKPDIHILCGLATGSIATRMKLSGFGIFCDGVGRYAMIDAFTEKKSMEGEGIHLGLPIAGVGKA